MINKIISFSDIPRKGKVPDSVTKSAQNMKERKKNWDCKEKDLKTKLQRIKRWTTKRKTEGNHDMKQVHSITWRSKLTEIKTPYIDTNNFI